MSGGRAIPVAQMRYGSLPSAHMGGQAEKGSDAGTYPVRSGQQPRPKGRSLHPDSTATPRISRDARLWLHSPMLQGRLTIAPSSPSPAG